MSVPYSRHQCAHRWSRALWQREVRDEACARWASTSTTATTSATASGGATTASTGPSSQASSDPKVVVFGGSGFVGSAVCRAAVDLGLKVTSVSRGGRPSFASGAEWASGVEWLRSDVENDEGQWKEALAGATGVVSTLGAFGNNKFMYKVCGLYNIKVLHAAKEAGVDRFSFISVHDFAFPGGWQAQNFLLRGYFQGKRDAEAEMAKLFHEKGVALRPGFVYGTRHAGNVNIPLGMVGAPIEAVINRLPRGLADIPIVGCAFVPPVSVDSVAKAALMAVLDPEVAGGPMNVWDIQKY
jgi:nucleoside-diphosphate-sugar epimerase